MAEARGVERVQSAHGTVALEANFQAVDLAPTHRENQMKIYRIFGFFAHM